MPNKCKQKYLDAIKENYRRYPSLSPKDCLIALVNKYKHEPRGWPNRLELADSLLVILQNPSLEDHQAVFYGFVLIDVIHNIEPLNADGDFAGILQAFMQHFKESALAKQCPKLFADLKLDYLRSDIGARELFFPEGTTAMPAPLADAVTVRTLASKKAVPETNFCHKFLDLFINSKNQIIAQLTAQQLKRLCIEFQIYFYTKKTAANLSGYPIGFSVKNKNLSINHLYDSTLVPAGSFCKESIKLIELFVYRRGALLDTLSVFGLLGTLAGKLEKDYKNRVGWDGRRGVIMSSSCYESLNNCFRVLAEKPLAELQAEIDSFYGKTQADTATHHVKTADVKANAAPKPPAPPAVAADDMKTSFAVMDVKLSSLYGGAAAAGVADSKQPAPGFGQPVGLYIPQKPATVVMAAASTANSASKALDDTKIQPLELDTGKPADSHRSDAFTL